MAENKIYLILDNIRSSENVGAIFRTSDAVGVSKIFLIGYTPSPTDRFGREQKKIAKSALGAEKVIPHEKREDLPELIEKLKKNNVKVVAVEQDSEAVDYNLVEIKEDAAFIFGNEVDGISKDILKMCHQIAEIPMKGTKESLNISVSVGVFLYKVLKI